jgi:uncharacterized protein
MTSKRPKRKDRPGVDRYGRTPLHNAIIDGQTAAALALIQAGSNLDAQDDDGWTPLHFAVRAGSAELVGALLAAGAGPDLADAHGNTPLSTAAFRSRGRGELIALLRAHGADPWYVNHHGVSPISLARTIANFDVRQFFADLPADREADA